MGEKGKIHIIAPGMPFDPLALRRSLQLVQSWGFDVEGDKKNLLKKNHPVCASDRQTRWQQLHEALMSPTEDIIWAVRGGYGSLHLIPELLKLRRPKVKKLLIGFSDITTLHLFFNQQWGWESWHGPHLDRLGSLSEKLQRDIQSRLKGRTDDFRFSSLKPLNASAQKLKSVRGVMAGGNLVTLQSSLGTPAALRGDGKILFFEDIGERGYRIDRVLEQFTQAKVFRKTKAVVFGSFVGGEEPNGKNLTRKVLQEFASYQKFPVFMGVPSGHIPQNPLLPLGTSALLVKNQTRFQLNISTEWRA